MSWYDSLCHECYLWQAVVVVAVQRVQILPWQRVKEEERDGGCDGVKGTRDNVRVGG